MRKLWELREVQATSDGVQIWAAGLVPGQPGRLLMVVGDDRFVGAILHEALPGGTVTGVRMRENGTGSEPFQATNLESALSGVAEAFRDERLNHLARVN